MRQYCWRGLAPSNYQQRGLSCVRRALSTIRTDESCNTTVPDVNEGALFTLPAGLESPSLWPSAAKLSISTPSVDDISIVEERQLGHKVNGIVGVGLRCRHGVAQAFARDPIRRARNDGRKAPDMPLDSSLFRLSCPMLVQEIDKWEAEGAVVHMNAEATGQSWRGQRPRWQTPHAPAHQEPIVEASSDEPLTALARGLTTAHVEHAAARLEILGKGRLDALLEDSPKDSSKGKLMRTILRSGIAGQLPTKIDVKCFHAQIADHLCRSESNAVGRLILQRLKTRGVDVHGTADCFNQCNLFKSRAEAETGWWYTSVKNGQKLRKRHVNRKKAKCRLEEQKCSASAPLSADAQPTMNQCASNRHTVL